MVGIGIVGLCMAQYKRAQSGRAGFDELALRKIERMQLYNENHIMQL